MVEPTITKLAKRMCKLYIDLLQLHNLSALPNTHIPICLSLAYKDMACLNGDAHLHELPKRSLGKNVMCIVQNCFSEIFESLVRQPNINQ